MRNPRNYQAETVVKRIKRRGEALKGMQGKRLDINERRTIVSLTANEQGV